MHVFNGCMTWIYAKFSLFPRIFQKNQRTLPIPLDKPIYIFQRYSRSWIYEWERKRENTWVFSGFFCKFLILLRHIVLFVLFRVFLYLLCCFCGLCGLFQLQSIWGSSISLLWIRRRFYLFIAIKYLFLYVFLILFCASSQSVIFCLCKSSMHSRKTSAFSSQNAVKPVAGL